MYRDVCRHQKEEAILNYLRQRKVPMRLQKKIREFYDYVWNTHIIQVNTTTLLPDEAGNISAMPLTYSLQ